MYSSIQEGYFPLPDISKIMLSATDCSAAAGLTSILGSRTGTANLSRLMGCGASRRDAGCLGYDCRADVLNPGTWLFFEKWQDDASLEKHMAAAHFKAFEQGVAPLLTAPLTIHKVME